MKIPVVRDTVRRATATLADGSELHTWNDLLGVVPGVFGVKTGHTDDAGWSQVAAVRGDGDHDLRHDPRQPLAHAAQRRPAGAARLRAQRSTGGSTRSRAGAATRRVELPYGRAPLQLVAAAPLQRRRGSGVRSTERVVAPARVVAAGRSGAGARARAGLRRRAAASARAPLVAARSVSSSPGLVAAAWGGTPARTVHNVVGLVTP